MSEGNNDILLYFLHVDINEIEAYCWTQRDLALSLFSSGVYPEVTEVSLFILKTFFLLVSYESLKI